MIRKSVGIFIGSVMLLATALTACGQQSGQVSTTAKPATNSPTATQSAAPQTSTGGAQTPKYGGQFTYVSARDTAGFDPYLHLHVDCLAEYNVTTDLIQGDWAKGPAGTKQTNWEIGFVGRSDLLKGTVAESWEMPDNSTVIYHIRKGVHWQNKPPANGRELTADDVVWNIKTDFNTPTAFFYANFPPNSPYAPTSITAVDKYTVQVKIPSVMLGLLTLHIGCNMWLIPPETWNNGGNMDDWHNVGGVGPFVLADYVSSSQMTFQKNPNYFEKDPLHPNNQLPYLDSMKMLIISDLSTRQSAFRTGKIDYIDGLYKEDADSIIAASKNLGVFKKLAAPNLLVGRVDIPGQPWGDIRVRQALNIAVDKQSILKDYFGGDGVMLAYPFPPTPTYSVYYTPLEQEPQDVQDLFKYDPTKAKQLLADAGYPNGFKVTVFVTQANADDVSMLKNQLSKVGVQLDISPKETGVFQAIQRGRTNTTEWLYRGAPFHAPHEMLEVRKESMDDGSYIDDPTFRATYEFVGANLGRNDTAVQQKLKATGTHELQTAWGLWMPGRYTTGLWWPWVQNYHGEYWLGWAGFYESYRYIWTDSEMKKSMGY